MAYLRVIPRDLFNESGLLKCYGRLWICLDNMARDHAAQLGEGDAAGDHTGAPFDIVQDEGTGALTVANLPFTVRGEPWTLTRPLNTRDPWSFYAETEENCVSVFTDSGDLSAEFLALIRSEVTSEER